MTSADPANLFHFAIRVYYGDTDAGGIVYHAKYLEFAERCRSEIMRSVGHPLISASGNQFVVREANVSWFHPARLDDLIIISTAIRDTTGARINMEHSFFLEEKMIVKISAQLAHVRQDGRPVRLDPSLIQKMRTFTAEE